MIRDSALAACLIAMLSACAGTGGVSERSTTSQTATLMQQQDAGSNRDLNAETVLAKLLELLDGSSSAKDFTPDRLVAAFGQPLNFDGARFGFGGPLTPAWRYGVNVDPAAMNGPMLMVTFDPEVSTDVPDATAVCGTDFDEFSAGLTKIGFSREVRHGEHGEIIAFEFSRSSLWVVVDVRGEADDPPEKVVHLCVTMVDVR